MSLAAPLSLNKSTDSIHAELPKGQDSMKEDAQNVPNNRRKSVSVNVVPALPDEHLVSWDGPDDPENPQNWSKARKWATVIVCMVMCINVTFASSAPTSLTLKIAAAFQISSTVSNLVTSLFIVGTVFGSVLWGPGSEVYGRKRVVLFALVCYTILHLGQALAKNIATLFVTRFLNGVFAVAPLAICGGIIADVMSPAERGLATSLFAASNFLGPILGPVVAGFVADSSLDWPWIFWIMMIFAGVCTAVTAVTLQETYVPLILLRKAQRLRKQDPEKYKDLKAEHENLDFSAMGLVNRTILRPFKMLALEPILVLITAYFSITFGILYALFEAFPIIFVEIRQFTTAQVGLIFIGTGIGTTIGAIVNAATLTNYPRLVEEWRGHPPPEARLYGAMFGAPALAIGSFWLGWTGNYPSIPWYVPAISTIMLGAGISAIVMSFMTYMVDTYLQYSASAFGANSIVRNCVAAAFPLFTVQMYHRLGTNWASTLVGLIAVLFAPSPFLFYKYGARIRSRSKFAPCLDLKIAEQIKAEKEGAV